VAYRGPDGAGRVTPDRRSNLTFVGLFGMIDPPREEVRPALALARGAGMRTMMITGDYPNTARAIAEQSDC
jgi:Ca2+-transporting ATPase